MKAMILAAGEGTRLRPLTTVLPKPMVPVANVPLLVRTISLLEAQGITEIAVNLYHRPEAIRAVLGDGKALGVRLHYSDETMLMGTAGGVKKMEAFLNETFLVLYGDNLYEADFVPLIKFHQATGGQGTIATFTTPNPTACGLVETDVTGQILRFQEKPPLEEVFTDQANAGVYVLEPTVFDYIPADTVYDFGKDVFPAMLTAGVPLFARPLYGYLQDTGTVPNYFKANWDVLSGATGATAEGSHQGTLLISPTATVALGAILEGRNVLGEGVRVGKEAMITESILWENVVVEPGATVRQAILGENVRIGAGATVGTGAILADNVTVAPGAVVENDARIAPNTVVE